MVFIILAIMMKSIIGGIKPTSQPKNQQSPKNSKIGQRTYLIGKGRKGLNKIIITRLEYVRHDIW